MKRAVALTQLVGWMAALAGGLKVLAWTDAGALRGPSLRHWSVALAWLTSHDPVITAFVAVRLLATFACGYLLVVTIVGVVAHLLDLRQVAAWAGRGNAGVAGKIMAAALGVGMVVTSVGVPAMAEGRGGGQPPPSAPAPPTMHRLGPTATTAPPTTTVAPPTPTTAPDDADQPGDDDTTTDPAADATVPGPPADPAPTPDALTTPAASAAPTAAPGPPTDPAPDVAEPAPQPPAENLVTIAPGDNLWVIAERSLAGALHRHPSIHETAPYWLHLVDTNRSRLTDPGNPDLVFPGQIIAVPPPPAG